MAARSPSNCSAKWCPKRWRKSATSSATKPSSPSPTSKPLTSSTASLRTTISWTSSPSPATNSWTDARILNHEEHEEREEEREERDSFPPFFVSSWLAFAGGAYNNGTVGAEAVAAV